MTPRERTKDLRVESIRPLVPPGILLEELPLPARAINALRNAEIVTVADLVQKIDEDLEQVKNLGDKSIEEIKTALAALGLSLGMRIDPNLLGALGRGGGK